MCNISWGPWQPPLGVYPALLEKEQCIRVPPVWALDLPSLFFCKDLPALVLAGSNTSRLAQEASAFARWRSAAAGEELPSGVLDLPRRPESVMFSES